MGESEVTSTFAGVLKRSLGDATSAVDLDVTPPKDGPRGRSCTR